MMLLALTLYLWLGGAVMLRYLVEQAGPGWEIANGWCWLAWPLIPVLAAAIWLADRVKGLGR